MLRLYALWTHPKDVAAFEKHYVEIHAPLTAAIPELRKLVLTRTGEALAEEPSPFHRIAELWFDDADALERAMSSPEFEATASDGAEMQRRFGVKLHSIYGPPVESALGPYTPTAR